MSRSETPIDDIKKAIYFALAAVVAFSLMNVPIKLLASSEDDSHYSLIQIIFFRSVFAMVPVIFMLWQDKAWGYLKTDNLSGHLSRAVIGLAAMFLNFWAFALLPLADATAIHFAVPIMLTALSIPLLGEKVGPWRWGGIFVGFAGVLLILSPTFDSKAAMDAITQATAPEAAKTVDADNLQYGLGAMVALFGAFITALAMIVVKRMGRTEHALAIVFYFTFFCLIISGLLLPFFWMTPTLIDWALFFAVGVLGGIGQIFTTKAYRHGPAAFISPFSYLSIIVAAGAGFVIFGDVPAIEVWLGSAIVIGSGLFILYREHVKHKDTLRFGIYTMQPARPTECDLKTPPKDRNDKRNRDIIDLDESD